MKKMDYASIDFPIEYWDKRKTLLKAARNCYCFGKVRMTRTKYHCTMYFYNNTHLQYFLMGAINFGAYLKSKGYRTLGNKFAFDDEGNED